jgi:hypothetical protein
MYFKAANETDFEFISELDLANSDFRPVVVSLNSLTQTRNDSRNSSLEN